MKRAFIRSNIFNLAFYAWTAFGCVVFLPFLLMPRRIYVYIVHIWICGVTFLEKTILGLRYDIRGLNNLPASGSYIVAAKHQSPYETIKLRILFKDPAIVLKKELLSIPLWGWFLGKSDVIAIDRSTPDMAFRSLESGAARMMNQGRPIVIFPQGTRTWPDETTADKPYKSGVARVQAATGLPIVPMALNSGMFWPRSGWLKSGGTVVFEFLPAIAPGLEKQAVMDRLQQSLETATGQLMDEAVRMQKPARLSWMHGLILAAALFILYTGLWFYIAAKIPPAYDQIMIDLAGPTYKHAAPVISGFPGPIHVFISGEIIQTAQGSVSVQTIDLYAWPVPFIPVHFKTKAAQIKAVKWNNPVELDSISGTIVYFNQNLKILTSSIQHDDFNGDISGTIDLRAEPVPNVDLTVKLTNYESFLTYLASQKIIKAKDAMFTAAAFSLFNKNGAAEIPVTQRGQTLYAGPLPVASLPVLSRQEPGNQPAPDQ